MSGSQGGQYKDLCLPDSCQPVPTNLDNTTICIRGGCIVFYQGWKKGYDKDGVRDNIFEEDPPPQFNMQDNIFTVIRQVFLDEQLLKKLWMTQCVIIERGFLIFYQIMLPLCDKFFSEIQEGKWVSNYSEVDKWSNIYAYQIGLGGSYRLGFKYVKLTGTVCHYG